MSNEFKSSSQHSSGGRSTPASHSTVPGKHTLLESGAVPQPTEPGKHSLLDTPVQCKVGAVEQSGPVDVPVAAAHGISGSAGPLPHLDTIQRLFGRHDVGNIQAHMGGAAASGAEAMGAQAYATGNHVAFAGTPDLHTTAHEAAHVVQQRAGVHLKGGVGRAGDSYERHADTVADRVVAGRSAEALLDEMAPGGARDTGATVGAVQRMPKRTGGGGENPDRSQGQKRRRVTRSGGGNEGGGGSGGGGGGNGDDNHDQGSGVDDAESDGFPYSIKKNTYASFDAVGAPKDNGVASTQPIATPKVAGPAYIATVPTIGRGKDKPPVEVAVQYRDEAFDNPADAAARLALVVGVNRKESVTSPQAPQIATLNAMVDAVQGFRGFPLAADAHLWRPQWISNEDGAPADFEVVRTAAASAPDTARAAEDAGKPQIPAGAARTALAAAATTTAALDHMNQRFQQAYVHVGDPDAVNLKAKATPDAPAETGLFNRYDQVLAEHAAAGHGAPALVSGGYRFRENGVGNDPHAGQARKGVPQTVAANEIDMRVRDAVGGVNPAVPYPPEPNLLIRGDQIGNADFGTGGLESRRLVESMLNANLPPEQRNDGAAKRQWAKDNMLFDGRAALHTDAGRFDDQYTSESKYANGGTDVAGLFNQKRASQSHAVKRSLINQIKAFYRLGTDKKIFKIMELYLPQELFTLTDDANGQQLAAVRAALQAFPVTIETIDAYVRAQRHPSKQPTKEEVHAALTERLGQAPTPELRNKVSAAISDARALGEEWADVLDIAKAAGKAIADYLANFGT